MDPARNAGVDVLRCFLSASRHDDTSSFLSCAPCLGFIPDVRSPGGRCRLPHPAARKNWPLGPEPAYSLHAHARHDLWLGRQVEYEAPERWHPTS